MLTTFYLSLHEALVQLQGKVGSDFQEKKSFIESTETNK